MFLTANEWFFILHFELGGNKSPLVPATLVLLLLWVKKSLKIRLNNVIFLNNFVNPISNDQKVCFQNIAWPTNCRLKTNKAKCR
jgi:hypothetical protein